MSKLKLTRSRKAFTGLVAFPWVLALFSAILRTGFRSLDDGFVYLITGVTTLSNLGLATDAALLALVITTSFMLQPSRSGRRQRLLTMSVGFAASFWLALVFHYGVMAAASVNMIQLQGRF